MLLVISKRSGPAGAASVSADVKGRDKHQVRQNMHMACCVVYNWSPSDPYGQVENFNTFHPRSTIYVVTSLNAYHYQVRFESLYLRCSHAGGVTNDDSGRRGAICSVILCSLQRTSGSDLLHVMTRAVTGQIMKTVPLLCISGKVSSPVFNTMAHSVCGKGTMVTNTPRIEPQHSSVSECMSGLRGVQFHDKVMFDAKRNKEWTLYRR